MVYTHVCHTLKGHSLAQEVKGEMTLSLNQKKKNPHLNAILSPIQLSLCSVSRQGEMLNVHFYVPSIICLINRKQTPICISGEQHIKEMSFSWQMQVLDL